MQLITLQYLRSSCATDGPSAQRDFMYIKEKREMTGLISLQSRVKTVLLLLAYGKQNKFSIFKAWGHCRAKELLMENKSLEKLIWPLSSQFFMRPLSLQFGMVETSESKNNGWKPLKLTRQIKPVTKMIWLVVWPSKGSRANMKIKIAESAPLFFPVRIDSKTGITKKLCSLTIPASLLVEHRPDFLIPVSYPHEWDPMCGYR